MKKKTICIIALFVLLRASAFSQVFYKITHPGKQKVSYLFGTIHGASRIIIVPALVKERLAESGSLYLEVMEGLSKSAEANRLAGPYTLYPPGATIKDRLSTAEYDQLKRAFVQTGWVSDSTFDKDVAKFQPYFLNVLYLEARSDQRTFEGLDFKLERFARKSGVKHIRMFETPEELAGFHAQMAAKLSPSFFVKHLDSLYLDNLEVEKAYIDQDTASMHKFVDSIVTYRNMKWAKTLHAPLSKGGVFIAVGAAHLVGESGLVALLRLEGYHIEAIPIALGTITPVKK